MKRTSLYIILFILILIPFSAFSETTGENYITSSYTYAYNRTMGHKNEVFFQGQYTLSKYFSLGAGFSTAFNSLPERFYLNLDIINYPTFLRYRISLLSRDFPDYEIKENSIYPTIALLTKYFELELGLSFRIIETDPRNISTHTLYRLQFNIINLKSYGLSFKMTNFDAFRADNITALHLILENEIKINENFHLEVDLGMFNAGQIAFASYLTSVFGHIGVKYYL